MSEEKKMVKVTNRTYGHVGYSIKNSGIHRSFARGQSMTLPLDELKELQWEPGGEYALQHLFLIDDKTALEVLNMEVEPEYFYTEDEIREILVSGSLDRLEDTLNFAGDGVKDIIQKVAIELELPDTRKRKLIQEKLGFNIDTALAIRKQIETVEEEPTEEAQKQALTRKKESTSASGRKAPMPTATASTPNKYKIISK